MYISLRVPWASFIVNCQIKFMGNLSSMPEPLLQFFNSHISASFNFSIASKYLSYSFDSRRNTSSPLHNDVMCLAAAFLFHLTCNIFVPFEKTCSFQLINTKWRIFCTCTVHVHKVRTGCFTLRCVTALSMYIS
jgi:hypothetical protein